MGWKHGFEVTADVFLELPKCDAIEQRSTADLFGSPVGNQYEPCESKATRFYLLDGVIEVRCNHHVLSELDIRPLTEMSWDEYRVALVMLS